MPPSSRLSQPVRFGGFVADPRSGELCRDGAKIKLQEQPFKILTILLGRAGEVVTREELREELWPGDTFVDFDHGINVAIAKIREALCDSSEEPQYVKTVGRRGYRFIKAVEPVLEAPSPRAFRAAPIFRPAQRHSVGREKERVALASAFESVTTGSGLLACVAGEPGIGKTTLVEDFLAGLQSSGTPFYLARGRCSQRLAGSDAYLPFLEALADLLQEDHSGNRQKLRTVAPSWYAQLFPLSETDPADQRLHEYVTHSTQEKVKREFASFIAGLASQAPVALFFDDLHWADLSTVDLLNYLASRFEGMKVLVIVTYRPSELLHWNHSFVNVRRDLLARGLSREIDVEFLALQDVERYLALEFPHSSFPSEFAAMIHSRTEGNPLFMADLLRYLRACSRIVPSGGNERWKLAGSVPDLSRVLPESSKSMIEKKLEPLSERDREVLTAAAVEGYEFDSVSIARTLQLEFIEVEESLERLDRINAFVKRIAEEELPDGTVALRCRFVHVLYQEALYASLGPARRAALSGTLARVLEAAYSEKSSAIASRLAFLYESARDTGRASDYFLLAAQNAQRIFANHEAITLARRGLTLLKKVPDSPERMQRELGLQVTLAFSFLCTVGYAAPETGTHMERARELCEQLSDTASLVPVLFGLWTYYISKGEGMTSLHAAQLLLNTSQRIGDPAFLVGAKGAMGTSLTHRGDFPGALRQFQESSSLYDINEHGRYVQMYRLDPHLHGEGIFARTLCLLGFPDQASRKADEALKLARTLSSPLSLAFCQCLIIQVFQFLHQVVRVTEIGEECIALCSEHGILLERAWVSCVYGWAVAQNGKDGEGIGIVRTALDAQLSMGAQVARPQFLAVFAETLWHAGQYEDAIKAADEGLAVSARNGEYYYDAELWRLKGELLKMQGKTAEAEHCFQNALEISRQQAAKSLELRASTSLARLWQGQGKRKEARQLLTEIYAWFTEGFDTADLKEAASLLEEVS